MVRAARLTPANINEVVVGHELVQGDEAAVWADKGYVGPAMRQRLKAHAASRTGCSARPAGCAG
jgi:transposase, IS5 family